MSNEEFYIVQNPGETPRSYQAKKDYLAMGVGRSLEKLLAMYRQRKENGTGTAPTTLKATLARWSSIWGWVELSGRYDQWEGDRQWEEQLQARKQAYVEEAKEFAKLHKNLGKGSYKAAADAVKELIKFTEQNPKINDWDTAQKAANLCRMILPIADLWAKSLAISSLLDSKQLPWEE